MTERTPIPLVAIPISLESPEYQGLTTWAFADDFVIRMLLTDIPQRVRYGRCQVWIYQNPDLEIVGLGSLDICGDYQDYTDQTPHSYIPLLAVHPTIPSKGYGTSILEHLVREAKELARRSECHELLFLDVYTTSQKAISLYLKTGFSVITSQPISDPEAEGQSYHVMAQKLIEKSPPSPLGLDAVPAV
jgi:ribosomal protein S18 acetylase RimI-like enzyme